jgi:ACT domain-containing protein
MKDTIDDINQYDKAGLKELFRKSLALQNSNSDSTGNMGFIDMARKSGSKLVYQFERINDLYSYYILTVKVDERSD